MLLLRNYFALLSRTRTKNALVAVANMVMAAASAEVQVVIPGHCSSLGLLPGRIGEFLSPAVGRTGKRGREDADEGGEYGHESVDAVLVVQCHRDGIAWREFVPMLRYRSNPALLEHVVLVLVKRFVDSARILAPASRDGVVGESRQAEVQGLEEGAAEGRGAPPPSRRWHDRSMRRRRWTLGPGGGRFRRLLLIILPSCPGGASLRPERLWSSRLVVLENRLSVLRSLNAFISTLGGGFFLCRYLATAVRLARWQRAVALQLGDLNLAARCTVNEAYNYIHSGRVGLALRIVAAVRKKALLRGDGLTVSMCESARSFALRVGRANLEEGAKQATRDEMQRIRIVRNKARINRNFNPLLEIARV